MVGSGLVSPPIYVIHAKHLHERRTHIASELGRFGLSFEWVTEFDPAEITRPLEKAYFAPDHGLPPAHMSCALKHLGALARINAGGATSLVLEDDAILARGFPILLDRVMGELPDNASAYLGSGVRGHLPRKLTERERILYPHKTTTTTEAMLITPEVARRRLDWIRDFGIRKPIDTTFEDADRATGTLALFASPPLAEQGSLSGKFQSDISPKNRPAWMTAAVYRYKRFKRIYLGI
jgi:GR25 family glycosyltransferase involved in LPS biosynthesis